jgi:hypothetical protein
MKQTLYALSLMMMCAAAPCSAADAAEEMLAAYRLHRQGATSQALVIWQRLADRGDVNAAYNLAAVHHHADGVAYDPGKALAWYRVAAERGDREAQFMLGLMYQRGEGAPADPVEAQKWFTKHRREHALHHKYDAQFQQWQREARALIEERDRREAYAASRASADEVIAALKRRAGLPPDATPNIRLPLAQPPCSRYQPWRAARSSTLKGLRWP